MFWVGVLRRKAVHTDRAIAMGVVVCLLLLSKASAAQANGPAGQEPPDEIGSLELGHPVEGKLTGHEGHTYKLNLSDGQFLRFTVAAENPASNVQLTVFSPDGSKVGELSGPMCPFPLYFMPAVSGAYRLRLELLPSDASPETYKLQIDELREASDQDKTRTAASQALVEAYRLNAQDSPASKQQSVRRFEEAIALFRAAGDRRGEAEVLQVLSFRSFVARDYQGAVDYLRQAQPVWHALAEYDKEAAALEHG